MKKCILFIAVFCSLQSILYSQKVIWENEITLDERIYSSYVNSLIDSKGDIVIVADDGYIPFWNTQFLKYTKSGSLITKKKLNPPDSLYTSFFSNLYETESGYKLLGSRGLMPVTKFYCDHYANADLDKDGNLIKYFYDTAVYKTKFYDSLSHFYASDYVNKMTFNINTNYYSLYLKGSVKLNENSSLVNPHILAVCYDTNGSILWRKGYDSINTVAPNSYYAFLNSSKTYDNNMLIAIKHTFQQSKPRLKLTELDTFGNILENFEIEDSILDTIYPSSAYKIDSDNYAVISYIAHGSFIAFISIVNKNNNSLTYKYIDTAENFSSSNKIYISPEKNLYYFGLTYDSVKVADTIAIKKNICLYKFDHQGKLLWKYKTDKNYDTLSIKELVILDEHSVIACVSTGFYKFLTIRIDEENQNVNSNNNNKNLDIELLSSNPVKDRVKASIKTIYNPEDIKAELFNSTGIKVMDVSNKFIWNRSNGEGIIEFTTETLPAGAYYLGVTSKKENDIEGIIIQK